MVSPSANLGPPISILIDRELRATGISLPVARQFALARRNGREGLARRVGERRHALEPACATMRGRMPANAPLRQRHDDRSETQNARQLFRAPGAKRTPIQLTPHLSEIR